MDNFLFSFGQIVGKFCMFCFYILLPRFLGLEEYGRFAYALALCFIVAQPIIDFGLDMVVTKWVSRGRDTVAKKVFLLRIFTGFLGIISVLVASMIFKINFFLSLVLTFYLIFISFINIIFSFFRGKQIFIYEAFLFPTGKLLSLVLLIILSIFFHLKSSLLGAWSLFSSALLILGIGLIFFKKHYNILEGISPSYNNLLREGFTLFLTVILWMLYFRVDSLMLGFMVNVKEVGCYNTAYRLMEGSFVIPATVMAIFYPKLAKNSQNFCFIFLRTFLILTILGILSVILIYFFASPVISILYGDSFEKSIELLRLLSIVVLPVFIGHLTTQALVALDKSKLYFLFTLMATLLNICLNFIFIPRWYAFGAAWATIITESFITMMTGAWLWVKVLRVR